MLAYHGSEQDFGPLRALSRCAGIRVTKDESGKEYFSFTEQSNNQDKEEEIEKNVIELGL